MRLNPDLCLPHVALGEIYLDQERFDEAIVQLERARAIDPKEKSAYSHLAVAYRRLEDTDSARRILIMLKEFNQRTGLDAQPDETGFRQFPGSISKRPGLIGIFPFEFRAINAAWLQQGGRRYLANREHRRTIMGCLC